MLDRFKTHIEQNFNELFSGKTLVAVSGGVDSMVLLHLFKMLQLNFAVAHCNFQLRDKESDLDEILVADFCQQYNIPFFVKKFDTLLYTENQKVSIQIAARELRYNWFQEICDNFDYQLVATAHHLDDQAETFLINFTRGTGIDGLLGIPQKNENIIRPLLIFSREEILEFAQKQHVIWREDASNATIKYLRNKIRHLILPVLKQENEQFLKSFQNTLLNLSHAQLIMNDAVAFFEKECVKKTVNHLEIHLDKARHFSNYTHYLLEIFKSYGFYSLYEIEKICSAGSGKVLKNNQYTVLNDRDKLIIFKENKIKNDVFHIKHESDVENIPFFINISKINSDRIKSEKNTIFVNPNFLQWPLVLRKRISGDVFQPFGMKGIKKVSKFFKDEKLSQIQKDNTWILVNGDGKIIWIVGLRADNRFKITNNNNQKIYKITVTQ